MNIYKSAYGILRALFKYIMASFRTYFRFEADLNIMRRWKQKKKAWSREGGFKYYPESFDITEGPPGPPLRAMTDFFGVMIETKESERETGEWQERLDEWERDFDKAHRDDYDMSERWMI